MSRFHALEIADIRRETQDSVSIRFAVPDELTTAFTYQPGQYLTLRTMIEGEDVRRSYSICSGIADGELRIGVKKVAGGGFSTFANENLKVGDRIDVMPPEGRFSPTRIHDGAHYLGVAAGSGITPILSIAKSALAKDPASRFTLVYGNQTSQSVMFGEQIEDLKNQYLGRLSVIHILSREAQDCALLSGRITGDKLRELARGAIDLASIDEAFLCGPETMIADARETLAELGVPAEAVRSELFTPSAPRKAYKAPPAGAARGETIARVTVSLDGKRRSFDFAADDENIVDAAARAGLELPYSCKGGMCCTCRCKVESGAAEMAINYSLEDWETKAGFVLACQSRPTTPELAVDFDHL